MADITFLIGDDDISFSIDPEDIVFSIENLTEVTINTGGSGEASFANLDFTGSNITSILTRAHNDLQTIQGGAAGDYNHLTTVQLGGLHARQHSLAGTSDHVGITGSENNLMALTAAGQPKDSGITTVSLTGHLAAASIHFTQASIDHAVILNRGTHTHASLDSHVDDTTIHRLVGSISHASLSGTHNLTTDINHSSITGAHNLTTDINHASITGTHNLTTDISHASITGAHNLTSDISHHLLSNMNGATYSHLTATNLADLTDGGTTTLHSHSVDHGALSGLADDDHTGYALLAGRAGGQTLTGGTESGNSLTFQTTSNATKGSYLFPELTLGSVPFIGTGGALTQNNARIYWDNTYNRLLFGQSTPTIGSGDIINIQDTAISAGSTTLSYTIGGTTYTASSSITLHEGDICLMSSGAASREITTTATGTTFSIWPTPALAGTNTKTFSVLHPYMRMKDHLGNTRFSFSNRGMLNIIPGVGSKWSIYEALVVGDSSGNSKGGLYAIGRAVAGYVPFTALCGWDNGAASAFGRSLWFGGGNWGVPDANSISFVTDPSTGEAVDGGVQRLSIDKDGMITVSIADFPSVSNIGARFGIRGTTDTVQLKVLGHSTQTSNILEVKNSGDTTQYLVVTGAGNTELGGELTHKGSKLSFYNVGAAITKPTALTGASVASTGFTCSSPGTPDYAIADPTNTNAYGFTTADEFKSTMAVIKNALLRIEELNTKLQNLGLIA